ncbi:MAG: hypothetical protein Q9O24_08370 [Gammaproteobacteria bacterium]|nr:hypothetical protein [Gammaproteobacteria bacterium]
MSDAYLTAFKGAFTSLLRWSDLDDFWLRLKAQSGEDWYLYAVGEAPPMDVASRDGFHRFLAEMDLLLRREHEEDYCGIVYADDLHSPTFIKIYDPNNLGVSCGFSDNPPLPGWVLSKLPPIDLQVALPPPNNRRRWWNKLWS